MEPQDEICLCFHISKRKILNFIRIHRPRVPSQISECGGAGTGCGWCVPFLRRYFEEATGSRDGGSEPTKQEYALGRAKHIRAGKGVPPPGAAPPPQLDDADFDAGEIA